MKRAHLFCTLIILLLIVSPSFEARSANEMDKFLVRTQDRHLEARRNFDKIIQKFPEFMTELNAMAGRLKTNPDWLLNVMACESSFIPSARNSLPGQSASGLLQFVGRTAQRLGTTTTAIRRMNPVEQLQYVERYFAPFRGQLNSQADVYAAAFRGFIISGGHDRVAAPLSHSPKELRAYSLNKSLDINRDGRITKGELTTVAFSVGRFNGRDELAASMQTHGSQPSIDKQQNPKLRFIQQGSLYVVAPSAEENFRSILTEPDTRSIYFR